VGHRIDLPHTRALVHDALRGELEHCPMRKDPNFGFDVPVDCSGVPHHILDPRQTWEDPEAYDRQAAALVQKFKDNFAQFAPVVSPGWQRRGRFRPSTRLIG